MTTQTDLKLTRIGYLMIPVRDLARALAFYRDSLGLPVHFANDGHVLSIFGPKA